MNDVQLVIRVPSTLAERADALTPILAADPELGAVGRVTRSAVLRLALARGLASLERSSKRHNGGE